MRTTVRLRPALSFIPADEDRVRDGVLACLSLDVTAGCAGPCSKLIGRKGKQPEMVMVRPMAMRWTRAAIAHFPEIIDRLLDVLVPRGTLRKLGQDCRKIVGGPMVPGAAGCVGIITEQDK